MVKFVICSIIKIPLGAITNCPISTLFVFGSIPSKDFIVFAIWPFSIFNSINLSVFVVMIPTPLEFNVISFALW